MITVFKNMLISLSIMLCVLPAEVSAQHKYGEKPYQDLAHYSHVFGHQKLYRIYLPAGYHTSHKRYPVIYFFHGWGGRHYKDDNAKLDYAKIKLLADKYQLILVMWDGSMDGIEPNPYNIGNHEDIKFQVQMKDYFPELFSYIDARYRTLANRNHRGIIGFSMGGFMSLYMAGKYPDKVCAAVSLAGSAELFMGYPENQTLYPIRYTFQNLSDVDVRIHNGNTDILYFLNKEVEAGARWDDKKITYWEFPGGHMVDLPGETKVFEKAVKFLSEAFGKKHHAPETWSHYDLYPSYTLWGYKVESDKKEPGFLYLKNVNKNGFGLFTERWLPGGSSLEGVRVKVYTAPVYIPGRNYNIINYSYGTDSIQFYKQKSNGKGHLAFEVDGSGHQIGIYDKKDQPQFVVLDYSLGIKNGFLHTDRQNVLILRLLNTGGENSHDSIRVTLMATDTAIRIREKVLTLKTVAGQRIQTLPPIHISCSKNAPAHAEPMAIKFKVTIGVNRKLFSDDFTVPVWYKAASFDSVRIDDGVMIKDSTWGKGNGDGVADAGEVIMAYQGSHRLRLYTEDPWVVKQNEKLADEMIPARWPDGVTVSSLIRIAPGCPNGHQLILLGDYETKTFNPIERKLNWGTLIITVHNKN